MKKIAIIDPFLVSPSIHCFNHLVAELPAQLSYHQPHQIGFDTLRAQDFDGFVILGSASNVTEPLEWHNQLSEFCLNKLNQSKPVLGICFGHQLMAHALECEVGYIYETQEKLKGTRVITFLEDFGAITKGKSFQLAMTHQQMVKKLSPDLIEVARGLENDVIRHKSLPFTGIQPHPEGSKHFCLNNALIDSQETIELVQNMGLLFVKEWVKQV